MALQTVTLQQEHCPPPTSYYAYVCTHVKPNLHCTWKKSTECTVHCWVKLLPYLQNDYDESHTTSRISSAGENGKISVTPPRQKSLQIMVQTSFYCVLIRYNWGPTLLISHAEIYKVSEFYDSTKYTVVFTPSLYMLTVKWPPCWLTTILQIVTWFRRIVVRVCAEALCTLQSNCASLGDYCVCVNARCLLGKFPKELIKVTDFGH